MAVSDYIDDVRLHLMDKDEYNIIDPQEADDTIIEKSLNDATNKLNIIPPITGWSVDEWMGRAPTVLLDVAVGYVLRRLAFKNIRNDAVPPNSAGTIEGRRGQYYISLAKQILDAALQDAAYYKAYNNIADGFDTTYDLENDLTDSTE